MISLRSLPFTPLLSTKQSSHDAAPTVWHSCPPQVVEQDLQQQQPPSKLKDSELVTHGSDRFPSIIYTSPSGQR